MSRSTLDPRAIPPARLWTWVIAAFDLVTARWWQHVPLALALSFAASAQPTLLRLALGLAAVGLHAVLAEAVLARRSLWGSLRAGVPGLARLVLGWTLALGAVAGVLSAVMPPSVAPLPSSVGLTALAADPTGFAPGRALLQGAALAVFGPGALFFIALSIFARAPLLAAIDLSALAVARNPGVLPLGLAVGAALAGPALLSGLTVVLTLPWTGALIALAWHDVFLGQAPASRRRGVEHAPVASDRPALTDIKTRLAPLP